MMIPYHVEVTANASSTSVEMTDQKTLKVKVVASPNKGKANAMMIEALAEYFGISPSRVLVLSGETGKHKRVGIVYD